MKKNGYVVIIILLGAMILFCSLIILGWQKSKPDSSSGKLTIIDYAIHGWNILISQRNYLSENDPLVMEDAGLDQCAYQWAASPLPDVSLEIQGAFQKADHNEVSVTAEAYGENCIHPETGRIIKFLVMQTDIHILSRVEKVTEREKIGNKLVEYILVIDDIPMESIPGSQKGQVQVRFIGQDDEINLWFPYKQGLQAVMNGLSGVDLLEELGN